RRVESHRELLDAAGSLAAEVEEMRARFTSLAGARQALEARREAQRTAQERLDLIRFQREELEKAGLVPGEEAELQAERARPGHAERLGSPAGGGGGGHVLGRGLGGRHDGAGAGLAARGGASRSGARSRARPRRDGARGAGGGRRAAWPLPASARTRPGASRDGGAAARRSCPVAEE